MIPYKYLPFRYFLPFIPLILLIIVFKDAISIQFFFNPHAPDLQGLDGMAIQRQFFINSLKLQNTLFEYGFYQSLFFPITIVFSGYLYSRIKKDHLKHFIGRNQYYTRRLRESKFYFTGLIVFTFLFVLVIITIVAILTGQSAISQLEPYFDSHSFLSFFSSRTYLYMIYYTSIKCVALITNSLFFYHLIDYFGSYIKSSLLYLIFMWALSPLLYAFLPYYLPPMSSIMITAYGGVTFPHVLLSYTFYAVAYLYMRVRKPYEVT